MDLEVGRASYVLPDSEDSEVYHSEFASLPCVAGPILAHNEAGRAKKAAKRRTATNPRNEYCGNLDRHC